MPMKTLDDALVQLRRIEEHREAGAEREIRRIYKHLLKELRAFLGEIYALHADGDDLLSYALLQHKGVYARFLEEVELRLGGLTPKAAEVIREVVEDVYRAAYDGMVEAAKTVGGLEAAKAATPEIIRRAVENPVAGLTLKDTLERSRKEIIYDVKRQIGVGLTNGDRMSSMARRIAKSIEGDYRKAVTIARTEVHRVREAGHHDAAQSVEGAAKDAGLRMMKTWRTMKDGRVRRPEGKKKANHVKMDGVKIPVDESFDLGRGVKTLAPGQSGDAGNDINCRCYLSYSLEPVAEKRERGILKDVNLEPLPITDEAIEKVPIVESSVLSSQQCLTLREKHQELLRFVRGMKPKSEALVQYDLNFNRLGVFTSKPGQARVRETRASVPYIAMHNHPSGNGFTLNDIRQFARSRNMQVLTAVGHNGKVFKLEKTDIFDDAEFQLYVQAAIHEKVFATSEEYLVFVDKVLKGAEKYGVRYDR